MKTSTLLWLGGAAAVGYYLATRKSDAAAQTAAAQAVTSTPALTAPDQTPANQIAPSVIVVQPDDSYEGFYGPSWGWGPVGGGRRHHGGGGGGGGHGHGHGHPHGGH